MPNWTNEFGDFLRQHEESLRRDEEYRHELHLQAHAELLRSRQSETEQRMREYQESIWRSYQETERNRWYQMPNPSHPPPPRGSPTLTSCPNCGGCLGAGSDAHASCVACSCGPADPGVFLDPANARMMRPGSEGYIPPDPAARFCRARFNNAMVCTRAWGHLGDTEDPFRWEHAAHSGQVMTARWTHGYVPSVDLRTFVCSNCGGNNASGYVPCENDACRMRRYCNQCCACNRVPHQEQTGTFSGEASVRYPRYIGIEVECGKPSNSKVSGFHHIKDVASKWGLRIGSDGSIHDFRASTEISTVPARGDKLAEQIKDLGNALIKDDLKANSSCGLHVHVDVRDYVAENLMAFVGLWAKVEAPMYRIVARSRRDNHYSAAWGERFRDSGVLDGRFSVAERMAKLDLLLYGSASSAAAVKRGRSKHDSRYHGVNFNAIPVHGTIEFRLHHGTVNPVKIAMWSAICSALVEYAFRHTDEEIRSLKYPPTELLERVVNDPEVIAWMRARRLLFANMERKRRGLVPIAKKMKAEASRIPLADPGEVEMSEAG